MLSLIRDVESKYFFSLDAELEEVDSNKGQSSFPGGQESSRTVVDTHHHPHHHQSAQQQQSANDYRKVVSESQGPSHRKRPHDGHRNNMESSPKRVVDFKSKLKGKITVNNRTLEIKKVPRELNNISKLNEYFQKFGSIVNLQVSIMIDRPIFSDIKACYFGSYP